jgi:hypothetical protein
MFALSTCTMYSTEHKMAIEAIDVPAKGHLLRNYLIITEIKKQNKTRLQCNEVGSDPMQLSYNRSAIYLCV